MVLLICLGAGCGMGVSSEPHKTSTDPQAGECDDPDGPLHHYTKKAELDQLVLGTWRYCSGRRLLDQNELGIEFAADNNYYLLGDNGEGGLVRLGGFANTGTWDTYQETASSVQLSWHPTPNSGLGSSPLFEDSPRKLAITVHYQTEPAIYVWTGPPAP